MFSRSRALILVRTADAGAVLAALGAYLRKWDFRPRDALPPGYRGAAGQEVRELYWRPADATCPWTVLAIADLQNALHTAYALATALPKLPVLVSRAYRGGDWQLKVYHDKDCVLKVGDDPDHELAWVGRKLEADGIPALAQLLGGGAAFVQFLGDVLGGRPDPSDLEVGLSLPSLAVGFDEVRAQSLPGWTYGLYVHRTSPLWR